MGRRNLWGCAALLSVFPAGFALFLCIATFIGIQRDCPDAWDCDEAQVAFAIATLLSVIFCGLAAALIAGFMRSVRAHD